MSLFHEITFIILLATGISFIMRLLRQPLIAGYILTGLIAGPYMLNIVHAKESLELFSKIGITILLFIVGLNLSPRVIREVGKVSLVTGLGQVIVTSIVGFGIAIFLGIERIAAIYIAIALTFSSTIIILKLLSDKGDLNKLYGKISIGFLLVQDIIASIILLVISSASQHTNLPLSTLVSVTLLKGLILISVLFLISTHILPRLGKFVADSQELLFLFSISWGLGLATAFYLMGFSVEIGALVAGVMLSLTPFAHEIGSRLKPLRDFFIVLFFILLGSQMVLTDIHKLIIPAIVLSLYVLIGNPIIMIMLMNFLGYKRRTSFMAGLSVAQISEFSLILATLGFNMGHLSGEILSLITLVGLITIGGSTYFILYAEKIYPQVESLLKFLEFKKRKNMHSEGEAETYNALLFGYDRVGEIFIRAFDKLEKDFLVVDFNPVIIEQLKAQQIPHKFGDAEDVEFLHELHGSSLKLVVSTIPYLKTNLLIIHTMKRLNPKAILIVIAHDEKSAIQLYEEGATYVVMPHFLGAKHASDMISKLGFSKESFVEEKEKHLKHLALNS